MAATLSLPSRRQPPSSLSPPSSNPDFIRAFANTNVSLAITAPNGEIPNPVNLPYAKTWIQSNILPFLPATKISLLFLGNEIMATADRNLMAHLVPAMRTVTAALSAAGHPEIRVSTPHSLGILSSEPPSSGRFRKGYDRIIFAPMLKYHRDTKTPSRSRGGRGENPRRRGRGGGWTRGGRRRGGGRRWWGHRGRSGGRRRGGKG